MNLLFTIAAFAVTLGVLIVIHELGHYWVARRCNVKVLRFSIGFGRPLLRWVRGADRTEWVLAAVPLGGYVRMLDERDGTVPSEDLPRSFTRRPPWARILVLLAGPAANLIFAVAVLWGMLWVQGELSVKPVVGDVTIGSLADKAGLRSKDVIVNMNGRQIAALKLITHAWPEPRWMVSRW